MYYLLKTNDSLSSLAKKFSIPSELILAYNDFIESSASLPGGQSIFIPNIEDIPNHVFSFSTVNNTSIIQRARSAINRGIRYDLGGGGINPALQLPTNDNKCDCSGFVCWVLGLSRKTNIPFYQKFGGWIYTDSMTADINSPAGIFEKINVPEEGCIVVYPSPQKGKVGHTGIVSQVVNGKMTKVIHCSSGNDGKYGDAIQETSPAVFNRPDIVWGRFVL